MMVEDHLLVDAVPESIEDSDADTAVDDPIQYAEWVQQVYADAHAEQQADFRLDEEERDAREFPWLVEDAPFAAVPRRRHRSCRSSRHRGSLQGHEDPSRRLSYSRQLSSRLVVGTLGIWLVKLAWTFTDPSARRHQPVLSQPLR